MAITVPMGLASFRTWSSNAAIAWPVFQARRRERLAEGHCYAGAPEKVAENIVEDLLTAVLSWPPSDLNHQVARCDILLTQLGIRRLVVDWAGWDAAVTAMIDERGPHGARAFGQG
jgi:hypothetical protein